MGWRGYVCAVCQQRDGLGRGPLWRSGRRALSATTLPYYAMYVERPDGSVKYLEHDSLYVRVFAPATPDDFFADPCGFLATESPVAEGLVKFHSVDNDLNVSGHRINTWGYNVNGPVYDLMGLCPNEIMQLKVVRKFSIPKNADFPDCLPDCVKTKVSRGPRLTCKAY